jgi:hypothetical protein
VAGHPVSRWLVLAATVAIVVGAGAAMAGGAGAREGSRAADEVAHRVVTHSEHVAALTWRQQGDQWECPQSGGPLVTAAAKRPSPRCRRATVTFAENLRRGMIVSSLSTATAEGMPTHLDLDTAGGAWTRSGAARCWDSDGTASLNIPAFSYTGERLSIVARTPSTVSLRGVEPGFQEIDTIDAHTFTVRSIQEREPSQSGTAHLVAVFTEMAHHFALPRRPRHVCSDIVRFPKPHVR